MVRDDGAQPPARARIVRRSDNKQAGVVINMAMTEAEVDVVVAEVYAVFRRRRAKAAGDPTLIGTAISDSVVMLVDEGVEMETACSKVLIFARQQNVTGEGVDICIERGRVKAAGRLNANGAATSPAARADKLAESAPLPGPTEATQQRLSLRGAGYSPLPIQGKAPPLKGWQDKLESNADEIELWGKTYAYAQSTGILTSLTPALDIDLRNPEAAAAVENLVREHLGDREGVFLVRIGNAPKRAILFQTDKPFKKIQVSLTAPDGSTDQKIEFLGDGQQIVAFGIHPTTNRPYSWHGGVPGPAVPRDALPYINEDEARELVNAAADLVIREHDYAIKGASTSAKASGSNSSAPSHVEAGVHPRDWAEDLGNIAVGWELHDSIASLAMKLLKSGMSDGAAVNFIRAQMDASTALRNKRWQERYDDIPRAAATARSKLGKASNTSPSTGEKSGDGMDVHAADTIESAAASSYKMRGMRWFWKNRFALGKLGLIGGLPDRGKGLITTDMIARGTRGDEWPCKEGRAIQGNVLLLTAEDDIEDTVVPRLQAAGADLDCVHILRMTNRDSTRRMFSLVTDLDLLKKKIAEVGNVVLIVIDPISAYLGVGKIDSRRTTDVRGVLAPLVELAGEEKVAIIGVMHFNKKADVHDAMLRIADSLAYVAAARHCYVVVEDPENDRRLFVKAKNNLAPDTQALSYTVGLLKVGDDEELGIEIYAPRVLWGAEHVNVTATDAIKAEAGVASSSKTGARDVAKKFLADILANGPVSKSDIDDAAGGNGIALRTLERAKSDLGVIAKKNGFDSGWMWQLPDGNTTRRRYDFDH
jgi:hypothetical protein